MERLSSLWVDKAMIRLLLSDIDGTLIQYDPKIHKTDVDAIHQLQEHGVQFSGSCEWAGSNRTALGIWDNARVGGAVG